MTTTEQITSRPANRPRFYAITRTGSQGLPEVLAFGDDRKAVLDVAHREITGTDIYSTTKRLNLRIVTRNGLARAAHLSPAHEPFATFEFEAGRIATPAGGFRF